MRRPVRFLAAFWILAAIAGTAVAVEPPAIPQVLYTDLPDQLDHEHPTWMAADVAVDEQGRPSSRYSSDFSSSLRSLLGSPVPGRCTEIDTFYDAWNGPVGRESLADALAKDPLIVRGTVTASSFGFEWVEPGQLFRLEVDQVFRAENPLDVYYFFVPVGRFKAGPYEICKTDANFPQVPAIGDEVVLLGPAVVNPAERMVRTSRDASLIVIKPDGALVLPRRYRSELTEATRGELLAWIESQLGDFRP